MVWVKCLAHRLPVYRKGLTNVELLLFIASAREASKVELSASLREGNEWVAYKSPRCGVGVGTGNRAKGARGRGLFQLHFRFR